MYMHDIQLRVIIRRGLIESRGLDAGTIEICLAR